MAWSMPERVAIMGMTWRCEAVRTSSWAMKFSGSLMARYSSSPRVRTGTTPNFLARFLETYLVISGSMSAEDRSIKSMPSCIIRASISWRSVMMPSAMRYSPRRIFFSF